MNWAFVSGQTEPAKRIFPGCNCSGHQGTLQHVPFAFWFSVARRLLRKYYSVELDCTSQPPGYYIPKSLESCVCNPAHQMFLISPPSELQLDFILLALKNSNKGVSVVSQGAYKIKILANITIRVLAVLHAAAMEFPPCHPLPITVSINRACSFSSLFCSLQPDLLL